MGRDGKPTRDKILSESRALVLENGFSGTSIDQILAKTGITKGAFFYHFRSKNALAKALIDEFAREDIAHMEQALEETGRLEGDSLDRLLQFIQFYIDMMSDLEEPYPGCLYASYTYETNQFDRETREKISDTILLWRRKLLLLLEDVLEEYELRTELDIPSLADLFTVIIEGAFLLSKALNEANLVARQLILLQQYYELIFVKKE